MTPHQKAIAEARNFKETHKLTMEQYFELLDIVHKAYITGYYEGADMVRDIYNPGVFKLSKEQEVSE